MTGDIKEEGLSFGGIELARFDKNLRLGPVCGRGGARLSTADGSFFEFALSLERSLERCAGHPYMPRRAAPQFPVLGIIGAPRNSLLVDLKCLPKRQVIRLTSPAHDLEGQPNAVLEAIACGCPLALSDITAGPPSLGSARIGSADGK